MNTAKANDARQAASDIKPSPQLDPMGRRGDRFTWGLTGLLLVLSLADITILHSLMDAAFGELQFFTWVLALAIITVANVAAFEFGRLLKQGKNVFSMASLVAWVLVAGVLCYFRWNQHLLIVEASEVDDGLNQTATEQAQTNPENMMTALLMLALLTATGVGLAVVGYASYRPVYSRYRYEMRQLEKLQKKLPRLEALVARVASENRAANNRRQALEQNYIAADKLAVERCRWAQRRARELMAKHLGDPASSVMVRTAEAEALKTLIAQSSGPDARDSAQIDAAGSKEALKT